jgi:hypothetical protein
LPFGKKLIEFGLRALKEAYIRFMVFGPNKGPKASSPVLSTPLTTKSTDSNSLLFTIYVA